MSGRRSGRSQQVAIRAGDDEWPTELKTCLRVKYPEVLEELNHAVNIHQLRHDGFSFTSWETHGEHRDGLRHSWNSGKVGTVGNVGKFVVIIMTGCVKVGTVGKSETREEHRDGFAKSEKSSIVTGCPKLRIRTCRASTTLKNIVTPCRLRTSRRLKRPSTVDVENEWTEVTRSRRT